MGSTNSYEKRFYGVIKAWLAGEEKEVEPFKSKRYEDKRGFFQWPYQTAPIPEEDSPRLSTDGVGIYMFGAMIGHKRDDIIVLTDPIFWDMPTARIMIHFITDYLSEGSYIFTRSEEMMEPLTTHYKGYSIDVAIKMAADYCAKGKEHRTWEIGREKRMKKKPTRWTYNRLLRTVYRRDPRLDYDICGGCRRHIMGGQLCIDCLMSVETEIQNLNAKVITKSHYERYRNRKRCEFVIRSVLKTDNYYKCFLCGNHVENEYLIHAMYPRIRGWLRASIPRYCCEYHYNIVYQSDFMRRKHNG